MPEPTSRLNVIQEGGITVVELLDRKILDEVNILQIGDQLNAIVAEADSPAMVLDFGAVAHLSSSALGMLITLHKRIREKNGRLRLCTIQPAIHEIFVITRLNEIFDIFPSRDKAVAGLA
ncbi:MAG: STAS domain-containing protein [Planctomycetota bacterium]|jgi:anti-sigma B factor antagonist